MSEKIHFLYEESKAPNASFANTLIQALGQTDINHAENIVSIGGDGMLLRAFRDSSIGQKICGIVPPGSNSRGFWTNKNITNPEQLKSVLNSNVFYSVKPLKAEITFTDGSTQTRYAYNDISVRPLPQQLNDELKNEFNLSNDDISIQSALLNVKVSFNESAINLGRIMGGGLVLATPFGSTAMNRHYGGPAVDIRSPSIILTGIGVTEPERGFSPVVNSDSAVFEIDILSEEKRPVMVSFDSFAVANHESLYKIKSVKISVAHDRAVHFVLAEDPGTRAYSSIIQRNER